MTETMTLDAVRAAIAGTDADEDWNHITCWGGGGPSYRDRAAFSDASESHSNVAILKSNVDISIAWGMQLDEREPGKPPARSFDWADNLPDSSVNILIGDVFYRSGLIDRVLMASIDGARCLLPWAHQQHSGPHKGKITTSQWWYDFTYLVDGMEGMRQFDEYWPQVGFEVVG
ncbi:hypothetical protein RhoFasGS6_03935 [Rhodococcus fascians]|uniref:hypothetical protein n=1 Tax=Rhodococcoides fascians TaxID=1828 RepID=UPI0016A9BED0|nr:hypothetical protein [Rhodococcus fascians]